MKKVKSNSKNEYPWFKFYVNMKSHVEYPDVSMYGLIKKASVKYPTNIAYSYYGSKTTYKGLIRKIDEIACAFARAGVKKGTNVTICMPNTPEGIMSFYALNKIGAIANMMHPLSSEEELKYGMNLTDTEYLLVMDMVYPKIENIRDELNLKKIIWVSVSESMDSAMRIGYKLTKGLKVKKPYGEDVISWFHFMSKAKYYKDKIEDKGKGNDNAVILHSGGTTGKPKGIVLTNMNFNSLVLSELEINKVLGDGVSILAIMPIFHGFGLGCTFHACWASGGHAIILPSVDPKKFDTTLLKYKPNILACVPSVLEGLTYSRKLKDEDLSFIKCIICGGDTLSSKLEYRIDDFLYDHGSDTKVRTAFGMTECAAGVTMMPLETTREESIGIPCPDCFIKICKPGTTEELKVGQIGEMCINGPTVMKEYIKEPKETAGMLRLHEDNKIWLHSGDMASMDAEGFVYFKGRLKRMIVSSGYNIYPGQIESIILDSPYVKQCVVIGVPHPYKKEVVKAYIVLKDDIELTSEVKKSIRELCEKNIAAYALPYAYGYRKELPKTKLGKVAYRDIKDEDNIDEDDPHAKTK